MAEVIHIADGESHCRIVDPSAGTLQAPIRQISGAGMLLDTRMQFELQAALDLTVVLKGLQPRQFFATVAMSDGQGLHLTWMPIDAGETARLRSLLEAYRTLRPQQAEPVPVEAAAATTGVREKTRRVIKPKAIASESATAIVPFAEAPSAPAEAKSEEAKAIKEIAAAQATTGTPTSERVRTRRILRPSSQKLPRVEEEIFKEDLAKSEARGDKPEKREPRAENTPQTGSVLREETGSQRVIADVDEGAYGADDPGAGKAPVVGADGRMDIGATIRSKARSVRASELAARHERVRVLNMATIKQLIQEAVEEASAHLTRSLGEQDRKRLLEEAEENFKERLKAFEAEKLTSEMKAKQLADQLRTAQDLLESERKRTVTKDQFTVSAAGLDEIEAKFKRLLDHSIAEGRVVPALEEELRKVIATVFDQERQRIREQELQAQNEKINLLETKIKRLASSLEDTERQRDEMQEWAKMLEASGGGALRNVFEAGLKEGDPNKKRKLALMKEILDINREMRAALGIATNPVDEETAEAIKKVEAESKLTPEEQAALLERRKRLEADEPKPSDRLMAAEMANVAAESGNGNGDGAEPAAEAEASSNGIDPDDADWKPTPLKAGAGGIKRVTSSGEETIAEGGEVDPDDMPWEPPAKTAAAEEPAAKGGIKKISAGADFKVPPLQKKKGGK